jgi:hypothetical protein
MGSRESGRPKYSAQVHADIVKNLEAGAFKKHAAEAVGVSINTLTQWLQWGDEGREPYAQFALDVERAIARDAVRNQTIISAAAAGEHKGDWKAAAWNLERKFPKLYGAMTAGHDATRTGRDIVFSPWKQSAATPEN